MFPKQYFENENIQKEILDLLKGSYLNLIKIISLQGESGSGKSTLIKNIISVLQRQHKVYYFNPLLNDGSKNIVNLLLDRIKDTFAEGTLKNCNELLNKNVPFYEVKDYINKNEKEKIFLFIDDIDSLESKSLKQLLNAIKYGLNFKNIIYVLNYDEEIINCNLARYFGRKGDALAIKYLSKIVDLQFNMKIINKSELVDYIILNLNDIISTKGIDFDSDKKTKLLLIFKELFKDKVKNLRLANEYLTLVEYSNLNKIENTFNFLIKEAVKTFNFKVYKNIDSNDKNLDEHIIRIAISDMKKEGEVSSIEDRALLIEKTIESLLCERE